MSDDSTRTGFLPWLSAGGAAYFQECLRQANYVGQEATSPPVAASTQPSTVDILRSVQTVAGDRAAGIKATYEQVPGLDAVPALIHWPGRTRSLPSALNAWADSPTDGAITLKTNQRLVTVVDVPEVSHAGFAFEPDVVLLTDHLQFDDPTYGPGAVWRVLATAPLDAAGLVTVLVEYARRS